MGKQVQAKHAIITDDCREARTPYGAFKEACSRLEEEYMQLCDAWPMGKGAKLHLKLELEYPDEDTRDD